jgi:glucosamine-6-phosphate deaminase
VKQLRYGELDVSVADSSEELAAASAEYFASAVRAELEEHEEIAVILATGNSQLGFIKAARERDDIEWSRVTVLHMDEYLGMDENHPASFRRWMRENVESFVELKAFHGVRGDHEPVEEEIERYSELLRTLDPAICVMGIGENGHLAFNDPPADFETRELIHPVVLDEVARKQQVGEGHFPSLEETPERALSLTVHALLKPRTVLVNTPDARKAAAVERALTGAVTPDCPASILQTMPHVRLFLDAESSARLELDS